MTKSTDSRATAQPAAAATLAPGVGPGQPLDPLGSPLLLVEPGRATLSRRLTYIMLVRVLLYTLLLGGTVALHVVWDRPAQLGGPYVTLLFVFIAVIYVLNILYAATLRFFVRVERMAVLQIAVDLVTSATLIHLTGGGNSAFILFALLSPIAAPIVLGRRAAVIAAAMGLLLLAAVILLGYLDLLPVFPGQTNLPSDITFSQMVRAILVNGGAMVAMAGMVVYLAEQANRQVAQQQLQIGNLAQLNEDIIRCLTTGLITIDGDSRVLTMNHTAADLLDVDAHTMRGRQLSAATPELARAIATCDQPIRNHELGISRRGERRVLGISTSPLTDRVNRRTGRIISFEDLTALRRMEASIRRSEHLAAIGRLAASIAHEIRNPLASISGSLELLHSESNLQPENQRLMAISLREIERLDRLISDLLDFARPRQPALEPLDIGREIHALVEAIGGLMAQETFPALRVGESEPGAWIEADRDQLRGLLWNLVRNAWQAGEHNEIRLQLRADEDTVKIAVVDRGHGMADDELEHIFEPFYTTRAKGSGLGLASVQRVVHDHGGQVTVHSEPGKGSTFTISLPRIAPAGPQRKS